MTVHSPHSLKNLRTSDSRATERHGTWVPVCRTDQLRVDVGVAALADGQQVALFRLDVDEIAAIGNLDPYSRANVLSRGIVGSRGEKVFVASPMFKQPFDLRTGACLDDPAVSVPVFTVRVVDGTVQVLSKPELPNQESSNLESSNLESPDRRSTGTRSQG